MANSTGLIWNNRFLDHVLEPGHPESPDRLRALNQCLKANGQWELFKPLPMTVDPTPYLVTIHTPEHIRAVSEIPNVGEIAALAVAGALECVKAVAEGSVTNAFCASRPPGHHAHNSGDEEGFCFYNNIAIAARYAQQVWGLKKIFIVDWDYHHGNGTQDVFYEDPSVLFFSTHRWAAYPGTGDPALRGNGTGYGFNINVDLPKGAQDADFLRAIEQHLVSKAEAFKPDLILISAGFDSRKEDALGDFRINDNAFRQATRIVMDIAKNAGHNRVVSLLEGGYNPKGLALAASAHLEALLDV